MTATSQYELIVSSLAEIREDFNNLTKRLERLERTDVPFSPNPIGKIQLIKYLREYAPTLGLKEAKEIADLIDVRATIDRMSNLFGPSEIFKNIIRDIIHKEFSQLRFSTSKE